MKYLLPLLIIFQVYATSANETIKPLPPLRGKNILKFIAKTKSLRDLSLYQIMKNRCDRYSYKSGDCKDNISYLIQSLDFDMEILDNPDSTNSGPWEIEKFVFAAFKNIFLKVLNTNKITDYLTQLNKVFVQDITQQVNHVEDFNLWTFTFNFFDRDVYVAAGVIATLFQDTSMAVTHLEYIRHKVKSSNTLILKNLDLLSDLIIKMTILEEDHNQETKKIFFPRSLDSKYFTSIYHFYVPYFLTQHLSRKHYLPSYQAKEAAIILNLSYEFVTTDTGYKYIFKDPETLNLKAHQNKLQDIYTGYMAANYGVDQTYFTASFFEIATAFSFSSYDAVTDYILIR